MDQSLKKCPQCGNGFFPKNPRHIYCDQKCKIKTFWARERAKGDALTKEFYADPDKFTLDRLNKIEYIKNEEQSTMDEVTEKIEERQKKDYLIEEDVALPPFTPFLNPLYAEVLEKAKALQPGHNFAVTIEEKIQGKQERIKRLLISNEVDVMIKRSKNTIYIMKV